MSTNTVAIAYRNAGWKDWNTVAGSGAAASGWPEPMGEAAFQGVAGDFVRLLLPETEADPAALLLTFLVGVGSMMGRGPHYRVGSTRHGVNLFTVVVGETSRARKGTATDLALDILSQVDKEFMASRLRSGLSSGEGLIEAVRDGREDDIAIKARDGSFLRFERQTVDNGEQDKRLLVIESEFSTVLHQAGREGNILSAILRDCWDGKPLRIVARSNKDSCQEPHVALIGNVTAEELQRLLTSTDRANGRAEAQVVRLSTLYAVLDGSRFICLEHLQAAHAVWRYCEESVRFVFGDVLGDETADAILKMLKGSPEGLTQTEINRSFHSHKSTAEMNRALTMLQGKGRVRAERLVTGGGPATRWSLLA